MNRKFTGFCQNVNRFENNEHFSLVLLTDFGFLQFKILRNELPCRSWQKRYL